MKQKKGFKSYENKCLRYIPELYSWSDAEKNCQTKYDANLVTILDRFEQYGLYQYQLGTLGPKWIGLSDTAKAGTYSWNNKDTVSFTNWDKNQPGLRSTLNIYIFMIVLN